MSDAAIADPEASGEKRTRILIAEDDHVSSRLLEVRLTNWGFDVVTTRDGMEAWEMLQQEDAPQLAVLDWMMPGMDGVEVCRRMREREGEGSFTYVILLTAKIRKEEVSEGLDAGADDYVTKPFNPQELHARIQVGIRMIEMQNRLAEHVKKLEEALANVKRLHGLLPICAYCKKIRDDKNYWQQVEEYITDYAEVRFSHGICPECYDRVVETELAGADLPNKGEA
jgi:DNA-binding response OmpR family regulator